jgi:hypothetical protein
VMFALFDRYVLGIEPRQDRPWRSPREQCRDLVGERIAMQVGRLVHEYARAKAHGSAEGWAHSAATFHLSHDEARNIDDPYWHGALTEVAARLAKSFPADVRTTFSVCHEYDGACDWHQYTVWVHPSAGSWMG